MRVGVDGDGAAAAAADAADAAMLPMADVFL
jgi:hypothetical protein